MQMPIRSLQSMLRLLQRHAGKPTTVVPDGIFGPETARAVREFQQQNGLPVTGAADRACCRPCGTTMTACRPFP